MARSRRVHPQAVLRSIKINHLLLLPRFPVVETVHPKHISLHLFLSCAANFHCQNEYIHFSNISPTSPRSRDLPNGRLPIGFSSSIVDVNNDSCFRHARLAHIIHLFAFSFVISGLRKSSSSCLLSFPPNSSVFYLGFSSRTLLVSVNLSR